MYGEIPYRKCLIFLVLLLFFLYKLQILCSDCIKDATLYYLFVYIFGLFSISIIGNTSQIQVHLQTPQTCKQKYFLYIFHAFANS